MSQGATEENTAERSNTGRNWIMNNQDNPQEKYINPRITVQINLNNVLSSDVLIISKSNSYNRQFEFLYHIRRRVESEPTLANSHLHGLI